MRVQDFTDSLSAEFYTGVPDSLLRPLCDYLMERYGAAGDRHVIGANEGNCVAIAAGYSLATGKVPVVYMQNSGMGNALNPILSLIHERVYGVPMIFVIGWRGESGLHDEPQHMVQGEVSPKLLEDAGVRCCLLEKDTGREEISAAVAAWRKKEAGEGKSIAFLVRKGALQYEKKLSYENAYSLGREEVIRHILAVSGSDPVLATTGKASRELYELREQAGREVGEDRHGLDFLTVGSMGHTTSIALGLALQRPDIPRIWCIDGDGAALMHMGAMAILGSRRPGNLIHILINNAAHESVGGLPTVGDQVDFPGIARACGYPRAASVSSYAELDEKLLEMKEGGELCFLEVRCAIGAREDLGRPAKTPKESKAAFMESLTKTP